MVTLERINQLNKIRKKRQEVRISRYLDQKLIAFLQSKDRDDALKSLVSVLETAGRLDNKHLFYNAILEREGIVSTGIGMGVAIPHAKLGNFLDFFIAIGIQKQEGIEWNALDKAPVRLIFMIGGPDNRQNEYLQILSRLTFAIKDEKIRKNLLTADKPSTVLKLLENF